MIRSFFDHRVGWYSPSGVQQDVAGVHHAEHRVHGLLTA
jgi:hypothetical protein